MFSDLSNENDVSKEYPEGLCNAFAVVYDLLGLLLHVFIFNNEHSKSA